MHKGIVLAGGLPRRDGCLPTVFPVYGDDQLMIYYPLSTLKLADVRQLQIISTPQDTPRFKQLLGDIWSISAAAGQRRQLSMNAIAALR